MKHMMLANMGHGRALTPFEKRQTISMSRGLPIITIVKDISGSINAVAIFLRCYCAWKLERKRRSQWKLSKHHRRILIQKASTGNYSARELRIKLNAEFEHYSALRTEDTFWLCIFGVSQFTDCAIFVCQASRSPSSLRAPKYLKEGQLLGLIYLFRRKAF